MCIKNWREIFSQSLHSFAVCSYIANILLASLVAIPILVFINRNHDKQAREGGDIRMFIPLVTCNNVFLFVGLTTTGT